MMTECTAGHGRYLEVERCAHFDGVFAAVVKDEDSPSGWRSVFSKHGERGEIATWIPEPLNEMFAIWCEEWLTNPNRVRVAGVQATA